MEPLKIPEILPPSCCERAARCIPVIGWIIACQLEAKRYHPALEEIGKQLRERSKPIIADDGSVRARLAIKISEEICREFRWPNSHFCWDDSFGLMMLDDDGQGVSIYESIEEFLSLPSGAVWGMAEELEKLRLAEVCDRLLRLQLGNKELRQLNPPTSTDKSDR